MNREAIEECGLRVTLYAMIATVVALPVTDAVGPIVRAIAEALGEMIGNY